MGTLTTYGGAATPAAERLWVVVSLLLWIHATACRQGPNGQAAPPSQRPPIAAAPPSPQPPTQDAGRRVTDPTVIIAARRTWDARGASRGPVDSLRRALEASTAELRRTLEERGVSVFFEVADSLVVTTDSGSEGVMVPYGDSTSYFLVSRHRRRPRMLLAGRQTRAQLLGDVASYLFTNEDPLDRAARALKRLPASAFPEVPAAFARELDSLGCTMPQLPPVWESFSRNVITGSFARRGQTDWAVLCSRAGVTRILVFWGSPSTCPRELEFGEEKQELEEIAGGQPEYLRWIVRYDSAGIAGIPVYGSEAEVMAARTEVFAGRGHDGIGDVFDEKGSSTWYCMNGRWINLGGGD